MKRIARYVVMVIVGLFVCTSVQLFSKPSKEPKTVKKEIKDLNTENPVNKGKHVYKKVLANDLTVLVYPLHHIPKVSLQMWYNVGSKQEKDGERGIAHLIEHTVFKGTTGKGSLHLSESDINVLMHSLSGSCNAFTSYDYTGYLFNLPRHNWKAILPVMADCMEHCSFKEEYLNSELKAVVQELKMYKDRYAHALIDDMIGMIFSDHPYHNPVIGYKHNLWSLHSNDLKNFYKKHYIPNNATLVIVGDVEVEEAFAEAKKYFEHIPADHLYERETFSYTPDIASKKIILYRDVQQPIGALFFVVPGTASGKEQYLDVISWLLGLGKGSRLQHLLVDELQLVTSLETFHLDLFEHALFGIAFEPKKQEDLARIRSVIENEITDLINNGFKKGELERAVKNAQVQLYDTFEDMQQMATEIGKFYLATGDPEYIFNYLKNPIDEIGMMAHNILKNYFRATVMHEGLILPIPEQEKSEWLILQERSDREDQMIMKERTRFSGVEEPSYAKKIASAPVSSFSFPHATAEKLTNGLQVLYYHNATTPKINILIEFKAKHYYDPENKQGLSLFMNRLLTEGTKNYTAKALADALESRGMRLQAAPGAIAMSMLSVDFEVGLTLLLEVLTCALFEEKDIEKIRTQILADIKSFWDEPTAFASQLIKEIVYKGHPYSKDILGTEESIKSITRDDLVQNYYRTITPKGTRIAIVGDLAHYNVPAVVADKLGSWQGKEVEEIDFPVLKQLTKKEEQYSINRDQIMLCMVDLSVNRTNEDYDKLLLFDQIFGFGALGSLASRLFMLREETGLFYTINGSVVAQATEQPGIVVVKSIVSIDRLKEAIERINKLIDNVAKTVSEHELSEAKQAVLTALINTFESNNGIAQSFIFLDRYGFAPDYFDKRATVLKPITVAAMQAAVNKVLGTDKLVTLMIGRVQEQ